MILDHFIALDRALVAAGFPPTSSWWHKRLERFYPSGRRQLVLRVGRRGGKSSTLCRVGVCEALYGKHHIPPGDVGIVGIVSVSRDEAASRLRTIRAILDVLKVGYRPIEGGIELTSRPIAFKVFTGSISGVVGGTWICAICDEVARWRDADTGANPAAEVLGSLRPTMATQPHAKIFLSSSPLSTEDAHAKAFTLGDTDFQIVEHASTWEASDNFVTEAETHALELDARIWRREFLGVPQAGTLSAFDPAAIDRAFTPRGIIDGERVTARIMVLDPSSGRKDAWTYALVSMLRNGAHKRLRFDKVDGFDAKFFEQASGDVVVDQLVAVAKGAGATSVHADQRESLMLASAFQKRKVSYVVHDWTASSKPEAVACVRRWFADGTIELPEHDRLRRELLNFEEKITSSGSFTFGARGTGHDDYVALLLTTSMAEMDDSLEPARIFSPGQLRARATTTIRPTDPPMAHQTHYGFRGGRGRGYG